RSWSSITLATWARLPIPTWSMRPLGNSSNGRITLAHPLTACGRSTALPRETRQRDSRSLQRRSAHMNPNKALWEKGDFTRIAQSMRESGDAIVESLGVKPGLKVLDLGCGDGTTALPAARRGADVLGVDIARNLVEAGNRGAREHGLTNLRFQEGDACDLG